ncbi:MAG: DinB family protein [Bacteroidota bacterium]|nr:DinB family protein [Bacteroidota bacterium]
MRKSEIIFMPEFFDRYIDLSEDEDILLSMERSLEIIENINIAELEDLGDKAYAPNKWTIKDIFQHIVDNERVQTYRALRFARNDRNQLQGFDQNLFANNTFARKRSLKDIIDELILVRKSTIALYKSFTQGMLKATGRANGVEISVLAIGFVISGHQKHHLNIIQERYIPLLTKSE